MLTNLIVVIISQYIGVSNHHTVLQNALCQLYLNKGGGKKEHMLNKNEISVS